VTPGRRHQRGCGPNASVNAGDRNKRQCFEKAGPPAAVAYAVVAFGGFLGMGEHYPLPWPNLKYDIRLGGYRTATEQQLKGAPKFNRSTDWGWYDRARGQAI
jgi:hypothetical protein